MSRFRVRQRQRIADKWEDFVASDPHGNFEIRNVLFADGSEGRGLFTRKKFIVQDFLLVYWGERVENADFDNVYVMELIVGPKRILIDATDETRSSLARFINDVDWNTKANCRSSLKTRDTDIHVVFYATKDIEPGLTLFLSVTL